MEDNKVIDVTKRKMTNQIGAHIITTDNGVFDGFYGPWNSFKEMVEVTLNDGDSVDESEVNELLSTIGLGVTVGIYDQNTNQVVEYWKPTILTDEEASVAEFGGFVRKTSESSSVINVNNYTDAITYATTENIGKTIYIYNESADVDGDGDIDNDDLNIIINYIADGIIPEGLTVDDLDANGDGVVDNRDCEYITQIINSGDSNVYNDIYVITGEGEITKFDESSLSHPIVGVADNSKPFLNIDSDKNLEAKVFDLFSIAELMEDSDYENDLDLDIDLGLCEAGNVYKYIESVRGTLLEAIEKKNEGFFIINPTITGITKYGKTLTVDSLPIINGVNLTYNWYASDTVDGEGVLIKSNSKTYAIAMDDIGKYIYVIASFDESDYFTGCSEKSNVLGPVEKMEATFKFTKTPYNIKYAVEPNKNGKYRVSTNKMIDDGCDLLFEVVSDENNIITGINPDTGELTINNNYNLGTARISAKIIGESDIYSYDTTYIEEDVNLTKTTVYYYGMSDQYIEEDNVSDGKFILTEGYKVTTDKSFTLTNKLYDSARSWYVLVPSGTNVSFVESSFSIPYKKKSYTYIDEFGDSFDVYGDISGSVYSSTWSLIVTIK